jgi:hypothetical protein
LVGRLWLVAVEGLSTDSVSEGGFQVERFTVTHFSSYAVVSIPQSCDEVVASR